MIVLGKFFVVMVDLLWDIYMEVYILFYYFIVVLLFIYLYEIKGYYYFLEWLIYFNIFYDNRKFVKVIFVIFWFIVNFFKLVLFKCMVIGKENLLLEFGIEIVFLFKFVLFLILYLYIFFMFDFFVLEIVLIFVSILKYCWYEEFYLCFVVCFFVFFSYFMV